jgi:hypothetical protein
MKLYRHHSEEFQAIIDACSYEFVSDVSRRFNNLSAVKNAARLFFYSTSEAGAEAYRKEDTALRVYEFNGTLLDLRTWEGRLALPEIVDMLVQQENQAKAETIKEWGALMTASKVRAMIRRSDEVESYNPVGRQTTLSDVMKDNPWNGTTYWGQRLTDFEMGEKVASAVRALGYDGFIINGSTPKGDDVALFSPATPAK